MSGVETGANTPAWYKWEDGSFAGDVSSASAIPFGPAATVDTDEGSNNAVRVMAPDTKEAADIISQNFEGSFTVSFTLADPWFLEAVFGAPETTGSGPYTHTYDGDSVNSMQIVEGFRGSGTKRKLKGCVVSQVRIQPQVPGQVNVSLNGAYATEGNPTETIESQPAYDYRPLTHAHTRLDLDGTKVKYVQDATVTINVQPNLVDALDSRTAVDFWTGSRQPDIEYTTLKEKSNDAPLQEFYGSTGSTEPQPTVGDSPMTMVFEHPVETNKLTMNFGGAFPDSYGHNSVGDPDQALEQNLNRMVKTVDAVAENDTDVAP